MRRKLENKYSMRNLFKIFPCFYFIFIFIKGNQNKIKIKIDSSFIFATSLLKLSMGVSSLHIFLRLICMHSNKIIEYIEVFRFNYRI